MNDFQDPFKEARKESRIKNTVFNGEEIPYVLRLKDLRKTVKDRASFSSDHPFKVVPHTEEKMRSMRQIPIEMDLFFCTILSGPCRTTTTLRCFPRCRTAFLSDTL